MKKRITTIIVCLLAAALALGALAGCAKNDDSKPGSSGDPGTTGEPGTTEEPVVTEAPAPEINVLAHWKLQNADGCFTGSVDDDSIGFKDLSGNGNDLIAKTVGNGGELDIFSWDTDVDAGKVKFPSALKMNNTKALAATVDPYKASETSYTGGYTSGKYLETVKGAPLNFNEFKNGFTIEVIFKLSPDLDNNYNRYTGIFSRQGVVEDQNEPPFSIALSEWDNDSATGTLGGNSTWLQLLMCDPDIKVNSEMDTILIGADEWHHVMITFDATMGKLMVYLDGTELYSSYVAFDRMYVTDPNYSWEVGVGRKWGGTSDAKVSKNENSPEGMIRRLFAGSIAEIRVSEGLLKMNQSLLASEFIN